MWHFQTQQVQFLSNWVWRFNPIYVTHNLSSAPPSKNAVSAFQISCELLSFTMKKLADDQRSSITKGSIYHIKHMYIQPFTTVVDWPEIRCLREVSTMFDICRYCVLLGTAELWAWEEWWVKQNLDNKMTNLNRNIFYHPSSISK